MQLPDVFDAIAPGLVGFGSRFSNGPGPKIFGTGFVIDARGVVATAGHVGRMLFELGRHPQTGEHAGYALPYAHPLETADGFGEQTAALVGVSKIAILTGFKQGTTRYGEDVPDLAFVQLSARELPVIQIGCRASH
jgi:hypothetical protein